MPIVPKLFQPVDAASLAFFRIGFGVCLIFHMLPHVLGESFYFDIAAPATRVPYPLLEWVRPVSREAMEAILLAMLVAAIGVTLGLAFRLSALTYALGSAYFQFVDAARYHNHFYLILLLAFVLALTPANRVASVDRWLIRGRAPATTPRWTIWLLRFQIGVPFFFSGLSKLNSEWLNGFPAIFFWGFFAERNEWARVIPPEAMALLIAWGGAITDVMIVPLLLWRRTRPFGIVLALLFNLGNAALFSGPPLHVATFPWIMISGVTLFLKPDWPRRAWARLRGGAQAPVEASVAPEGDGIRIGSLRGAGVGLLAAYVLVQVFVPLRFYLYPGFHLWTEFGRNFSWQMMASVKRGETDYIVTDPATDKTWVRNPQGVIINERYLEFSRKPVLIYDYAVRLKEQMAREGYPDCEVRVESFASLNGRPPQRLVDPTVDITTSPPRWGYVPWVLPLEAPRPALSEVRIARSSERAAAG